MAIKPSFALIAALAFWPLTALADGTQTPFVLVMPKKLDAHPMRSIRPAAYSCAIEISTGAGASQNVVTVGAGDSEMLSCIDLVEAAPLDALPDSIALVYDMESGPNRTFRGAVIVSLDAKTGLWQLNEDYSGDLTLSSDYQTVQSLNDALRQR